MEQKLLYLINSTHQSSNPPFMINFIQNTVTSVSLLPQSFICFQNSFTKKPFSKIQRQHQFYQLASNSISYLPSYSTNLLKYQQHISLVKSINIGLQAFFSLTHLSSSNTLKLIISNKDSIDITASGQQTQKSRLNSPFRPHFLKACIEKRLPISTVALLMYKIASFSESADSLTEKNPTFLSFILGVYLLVFPELMQSMSEFTPLLIGTLSKLQIFFTQLRLFFFFPNRRFFSIGFRVVAGRTRVLRRGRVVVGFLAERWKSLLHRELGISTKHGSLLIKYIFNIQSNKVIWRKRKNAAIAGFPFSQLQQSLAEVWSISVIVFKEGIRRGCYFLTIS